MILNYDPSDCLTPEQEAEIDAAYAEQEVDDWLRAWSDDFWSDEWLAVTPINTKDSVNASRDR